MAYDQMVETTAMCDLNSKVSDIFTKTSFQGKRVYIIAGGPSLKDRFDFTPLEKELTIGINRSFERYPTTLWHARDDDYYNNIVTGYFDKQYGTNIIKKFDGFSGIKIFLAQPARIIYSHGCYVVNRLYREIISYDISLGIYSGTNSSFSSIMLAIALGCRDIHLLGVDCKVTNQTHWHQGYEHTLEDFTERCKIFKKELMEWAPRFSENGIKITQLYLDSPDETALNCFTKLKMSDVVGV